MKYLIIFSTFLFLFSSVLFAPTASYALGFEDAQKQLEEAGSGTGLPQGELEPYVGRVINIALSIIGVIFLALMIYGGFLWMTARENTKQAEDATKVIKAAIIGIIVVTLAYGITYFFVEELLSEGTPVESAE